LFHDWAHYATRSAPGRPGVKHDRSFARLYYVLLETRIGNYQRFRFRGGVFGFAQVERRTTLAAFSDLFNRLTRIDAVPGSTFAASYNWHSFLPRRYKIQAIIS